MASKTIEVLASAFTLGYDPPTTDSPVWKDSVHIKKNGRRKLQRIVAYPSFYGTGRQRFDVVKIENAEDASPEIPDDLFPVWFAKALFL